VELENYSPEVQAALKKAGAGAGDTVEIKGPSSILTGILLPRPLIGGDPGSIIVKLGNGYNVGVGYDSSLSVKKVSGGRHLEVFPTAEFEDNPALPQISIVSTGGTISSRLDYETGGVKWLMEPGQIFFMAPELQDLVSIRNVSIPFLVGSENMSASHWKKIAQSVADELNSGASGALVTHGTDMMHYSSAALSFMLRNLTKPVVFTGSQRSTDRGSTDASMNLICAAVVAGRSPIGEVCLVMHGTIDDTHCLIHRGTRVRKMHTSRRDAFRSINELPIGKVWADGRLSIEGDHEQRSEGEVELDAVFEEKRRRLS
jgi:glutamyl-tRNA(Gln) amidotransferase subunit D